MDGALAIEHNREALKRVLAALVAMAGLSGAGLNGAGFSGAGAFLPRHLRNAVLRLLRPAESATRRLIIALARGLEHRPECAAVFGSRCENKDRQHRPECAAVGKSRCENKGCLTAPARPPRAVAPGQRSLIVRHGVGTGVVLPSGMHAFDGRMLSERRAEPLSQPLPKLPPAPARLRPLLLPLCDPPRRGARRRWVRQAAIPRVVVPGVSGCRAIAARPSPSPHDPLDATRLKRRLEALGRALDDLAGQALRFRRWQARQAEARARLAAAPRNGESREAAPAPSARAAFRWPLRLGRPPGARARSKHEIYAVLSHADRLARWALEHPNTS